VNRLELQGSRVPTLEVCENRRKGSRRFLAMIVSLALLFAAGALASRHASGRVLSFAPAITVSAQEPAARQPEPEAQSTQPMGEPNAAEASEHSESPWAIIFRLINFVVLAYGLVYLLRSPFAKYLDNRRTQIRADLVDAAETRRVSTERLAEIDERLKRLPGELDELRARGAEEIAAEEARIDRAAEAERERLLEQTRREIEMQLRAAQRDLVTQAANLSVGLATERVKQTITEADQRRLVDRYLEQLGAAR
jgi:F-type H+-transporting ATPase subunit b